MCLKNKLDFKTVNIYKQVRFINKKRELIINDAGTFSVNFLKYKHDFPVCPELQPKQCGSC